MTQTDVTDRQIRSFFADLAPGRPPEDLFDDSMASIARAPQRMGWLVGSTRRLGAAAQPQARLSGMGFALRLVLVVAALAAIVAGLLLFSSGGPRSRPVSVATPSLTPLRTPAPAKTPSHSIPVLPGERWILYERFTQLGGGLFVMRPDGTDSHQVLTDVPGVLKDADWSPDGEDVAFIDEQTEFMWIAGIDGSNAHRVAYCDGHSGCGHPAWSPDGTKIAFSRADSRNGIVGPAAVGIYVLDLASGNVTEVIRLSRPLLADVPRWSPDGTELLIGVDQMDNAAFETGAATAIVPLAGGEPRYLNSFDSFGYVADWNRSDGRIVYGVQVREAMRSIPPDDTWNLFTVLPDGTGRHQVTNEPAGTRLWFPTWTPDGTQILAADQGRRLAVLVDPQTGDVTPIGGADLARPLMRPLP